MQAILEPIPRQCCSPQGYSLGRVLETGVPCRGALKPDSSNRSDSERLCAAVSL